MISNDLAAEIERLRQENEMLNVNLEELAKTNEFLVSATWRERDMKQKLHVALEELTLTKKVVDEQNKNIRDSINYASRIQDAIIPKYDELKEKFADIFIYHKAKDIVSGDFPWFFESGDYVYMAAVDCTGHGVPGAMMSLIGHLLLNDIANKEPVGAAELLTQLHGSVVKTLRQLEPGRQTSDGMDVAMCRIDRKNNEVSFAGAHRPLYYLSGGELEVFKGDKFPIGGNQYKGRNEFTEHAIRVKPGDTIVFFSDGWTDQFGGPDDQKFGAKRVRELLVENAHLSMGDLRNKIESTFDEWKGNGKQLDDVLVIGIRF
jgi:serine phosphatase RsbU (regulator of sigma subunit)